MTRCPEEWCTLGKGNSSRNPGNAIRAVSWCQESRKPGMAVPAPPHVGPCSQPSHSCWRHRRGGRNSVAEPPAGPGFLFAFTGSHPDTLQSAPLQFSLLAEHTPAAVSLRRLVPRAQGVQFTCREPASNASLGVTADKAVPPNPEPQSLHASKSVQSGSNSRKTLLNVKRSANAEAICARMEDALGPAEATGWHACD